MGEFSSADQALGAFTDAAPWLVVPDAMRWRSTIEELRANAQAQVPGLVRVRRAPPWRGVAITGRLAITLVPWALRFGRGRQTPEARAALAARLRSSFEQLGTTFIKVGQLIGSADGMLAEEWVNEFKQCRDRVPAESFDHVRSVIENDFGASLETVFASFERTPLAAASIAQVHAATLHDGTEVVVKVQRPRIDKVVPKDIATMAWIAALVDRRFAQAVLANLPAYVELFAETIVEELDFRLEAQNMLDVAAVLALAPSRSVVVPRPHPELVSRRVLVMERVRGCSTDDGQSLADQGIDVSTVFRALLSSFFEGAMIYGAFHGDIHGGNMLVMQDGRPALLDFGITGRFSPPERRALLGLMLTMAGQDGRGALRHFRDLGGLPKDADLDRLAKEIDIDELVSQNATEVTPEQQAVQMRETANRLVAHGGKLPKSLFLYLKGNVYLNGAIATMAADVEMFEEMAKIYGYFIEHHGDELASLVDMAAMPDEAGLRRQMQQNAGIDGDKAGVTYRDMQEASAARQAEVRSAMKELG